MNKPDSIKSTLPVVEQKKPDAPPPVNCSTCLYFRKKGRSLGECIRMPPAVVVPTPMVTPYGPKAIFPIVEESWVCGEHPKFDTV